LNCPICAGDTRVLWKEGQDRRRECVGDGERKGCGHKFTTTEVLKDQHQRQQQAVQDVVAVAERLKAA
jgi:Zn ribbon nucleic-acid-binding protein